MKSTDPDDGLILTSDNGLELEHDYDWYLFNRLGGISGHFADSLGHNDAMRNDPDRVVQPPSDLPPSELSLFLATQCKVELERLVAEKNTAVSMENIAKITINLSRLKYGDVGMDVVFQVSLADWFHELIIKIENIIDGSGRTDWGYAFCKPSEHPRVRLWAIFMSSESLASEDEDI